MEKQEIISQLAKMKINILAFLLIVALIRLTNAYYYISQILGMKTEVNVLGGNAFNFSNYLAVGLLSLFLFIYRTKILLWKRTLWPFVVLIALYVLNYIFAPYAANSWLIYQLLFLGIGFLAHNAYLHLRKKKAPLPLLTINIFVICIGVYMITTLLMILSQVSLNEYMTNFNDSFVQSLDDYGIMKQRHGYLLGFVLSYALFIPRSILTRLFWILLLFFCAFGIRSFVIGAIGAFILFSLRNKVYLLMSILLGAAMIILLKPYYFDNIIYDNRFYSFYTAYYIVHHFPMGVGLGGYPVYIEIFSRNLFSELYNAQAILDFIPTAPESDIVHVFGSLGLLGGLVHWGVIGRILYFVISFRKVWNPFEKMMLFYFSFMTFYGISEDSMFSVNYWIFFGLASAIISWRLINKQSH